MHCAIAFFTIVSVITKVTTFTLSFTVNWTSSVPNYNYTVVWANLHTGVMYNRTVPGNTNSYTVTGLSGNANYNVSVTAVNKCESNPVTVCGEYKSYYIKYIPFGIRI